MRRPVDRIPLTAIAVAVVVAIGFVVRIGMMLRGGGLLGVGAYDDGVYYAGAVRLLHGDVPYRDFLFLQPPGILVALSPFAAVARVAGDPAALAAIHVAFELLGGLNAGLVLLVLRRFGWSAALSGGLFYAIFYPAAFDERTALLEPIGSTGVLVALLLLGRVRDGLTPPRAMLGAGVAIGVAIDMKIWFVVPGLIILAFASGGRLRMLVGTAATVVAGYLPFFLAAPAEAFRQIVLDQTGRDRSSSVVERFESFLGVAGNETISAIPHVVASALVPPATILLGVLVAVAWRDRRARVFIVLLGAAILVLLASPASYTHYASLVAVPLALVVGVAAGALGAAIRWRLLRPAAVVLVVLVVAGLSVRNELRGTEVAPPAAALQATAKRIPGCIIADDPTVLAAMDVLTRDVAHGCVIEPDMSGFSFDPRGRPAGAPDDLSRPRNAVYQAHVLAYLRSGAAFLQVRPEIGPSRATRAALAQNRVIAGSGQWTVRAGGTPR